MANFNLNKVILGGRLTADPELKATNNGTYVTSFAIAINRRYKQGEEVQTDFIDCVAWRERAELITRYFRKGSSICIEGTLQKRSWTDKQGQTRYAVEVVVDNVYFVDSKSESGHAQPAQTYIPDSYTSPAPSFEPLSDDDDLPF